MSDPIRVLVVDDDQRFAVNMSRLLQNRGFMAATAFDGFQAVGRILKEAFDVLVLDIKMPGLDGLSCLKEVKGLRPEAQVIILTGHAAFESGIEAIRQGAFDYLMKPCEVEELDGKIREAHRLSSIRKHPLLWPRTLVKEINRTDFVPVDVDDPVLDILEVFDRSAVQRFELHVTDREGILRGLIRKQDILKAARKDAPNRTWEQTLDNLKYLEGLRIKDIMQPSPSLSAEEDESLLAVLERMLDNNAHCLPVLKHGRLIGIIRLREVLQQVAYAAESLE